MQVYLPMFQKPVPAAAFVMSSTSGQGSLRASAEAAIYELDKDLALESFRTLDELLSFLMRGRKIALVLLVSFAGIGVALGLIGIYGVVSTSVVRMRREIAIRMALGATVRNTMLLVSKIGLVGALVGIAIGVALVLSLTRVLSAFLFGITPLDLPTYLLTTAFILLLTLIASLVPALRLLRLNPQDVLREQ